MHVYSTLCSITPLRLLGGGTLFQFGGISRCNCNLSPHINWGLKNLPIGALIGKLVKYLYCRSTKLISTFFSSFSVYITKVTFGFPIGSNCGPLFSFIYLFCMFPSSFPPSLLSFFLPAFLLAVCVCGYWIYFSGFLSTLPIIGFFLQRAPN